MAFKRGQKSPSKKGIQRSWSESEMKIIGWCLNHNIKGGGEWYDASYHGLLVHRDYDARTTKVKVLKVKFQNLGENGAEANFTWEPKSGSFIPHESLVAEGEAMPWES